MFQCRVGLELPEIEVSFKDLNVSAKAFVAGRALPSIANYFLNLGEVGLRYLGPCALQTLHTYIVKLLTISNILSRHNSL